MFRRTVYDRLDIPFPAERGFKRPADYVPKVLVTNRPGRTSRRIYNIQELEGLLSHYHLNFTIMTAFGTETSLASQVKCFQDVDLYIIVHGGGTINSIFLPPHSSLIELFPYGLKNPVYEHIASPLGTSSFFSAPHSPFLFLSSPLSLPPSTISLSLPPPCFFFYSEFLLFLLLSLHHLLSNRTTFNPPFLPFFQLIHSSFYFSFPSLCV